MSQARVEIEGYVSETPQMKFTESGKAVLSVSVPHNARKKTAAGDWENVGDTLWARFTLWEDDAHRFAELLVKGTQVVVSGVPEVRVWESGEKHGANLEIKFPRVSIIPPRTSERSQAGRGDAWSAPHAHSDTVPNSSPYSDDSSVPF